MESTAQRNSRINDEDFAAHTAFAHAQDFFNGLATYKITQDRPNWFTVYVATPHGRSTTNAKTLEQAEEIIAKWKSSAVFNGYPKHFFIKD